MDSDLLTPKEAMKALKIKDYRTLKKLVSQGLPVIAVGYFTRFSKADIDKFMQDHTKVNA